MKYSIVIFLVVAFVTGVGTASSHCMKTSVETIVTDSVHLDRNGQDSLLSEYKAEPSGFKRYVFACKDSLYGIYDIDRKEFVTKIEYTSIHLRNRKEVDEFTFCVFVTTQGDVTGLLSVCEENNETMSIVFPVQNQE